jgi:hypothetical protein
MCFRKRDVSRPASGRTGAPTRLNGTRDVV